ncbi:MAG: hypothetical protein IJN53_03405, partial [Oscillospiraceae bacterium]|nr:hypothetical protein [Oscillospiraceae bacterium]
MKQALKRSLSILVALALVLSLAVGIMPQHAHAASSFTTVGGWNETLYATISGISDADVKSVTYSGPTSGSLTGEDFEYLVRSTSGGVRLDILGLKAGSYTLTVETTSGTYSQSGIEVPAQDRSGFAHEGNTEGVGAYNDDGTLKDNAVILYVTNTNKNSLTLTAPDGTTVAGIGHILNSAGMDTGNGENASGGLPNNNNGILEKLSAANIPLVVRIVGRVTAPEGVTAEASYDYGGILSDNGSMVRMKNIKNITIEGVGASGTVDGWGFSFIAASGDHAKGYGRNFEVRNLTFENVPEDCVGLEGTAGTSGLDDPIEHCWIHHNTFVGPSLGGGGDKANGDGACDWKRAQYYTNSYNYYNTYRKTNLIGSNDSCLQYYATFHHNYWYDCSQRQPLCRQAEVHLYNNIWYSAGDYCISPRASSYVFVEYSWFDSNSDLVDSSGNIDCLGCVFTNNEQEPTSFNQITDKSQLSSDRLDGTYVESGDYIVQTDIEEMKAVVYSQTGAQRASGDASLDPDAPEADSGSNFIHNFTEHGTTSEFYSISGALSTSKGSTSYAGKSLTQCLVFDSADDYIKFTAPVAGKLTMVFGGSTSDKNNKILVNGTQYTIDSNNQLVTEIEAGEYTITKGDVVHIWYVKYAASEELPDSGDDTHTHSYTASVTTAATCTADGVKTFTCSCGSSYTAAIPATGHSYVDGVCSVCGASDGSTGGEGGDVTVPASAYIHNFTDDGFTSDFYTFAGSQLTNGKHGTYTYDFGYGTETLNYALKFDSAGSVSFTAPADGKLTIAAAASSTNRKVGVFDAANNEVGTLSVPNTNTLYVLTVDVSANTAYTVKRTSNESGLYYIAYVPNSGSGDVHTHSYSEKVTTAATCDKAGVKTFTCSCGASYTEAIPALGHSEVTVKGYAATC